MTPVTLDESQARDVRISLRHGDIGETQEWVAGDTLPSGQGVAHVTVPAGEVRIVAFRD